MPAAHNHRAGEENDRSTDQHAQKQRIVEVVPVSHRVVGGAKQLDTIDQVGQQRLFRRRAPQHQFDQRIDQ